MTGRSQFQTEHDWRIRIDGPLADYTYQRQGEATWALIEQGTGFA